MENIREELLEELRTVQHNLTEEQTDGEETSSTTGINMIDE